MKFSGAQRIALLALYTRDHPSEQHIVMEEHALTGRVNQLAFGPKGLLIDWVNGRPVYQWRIRIARPTYRVLAKAGLVVSNELTPSGEEAAAAIKAEVSLKRLAAKS